MGNKIEYELPETTFVRDIDDRVFKAIAVECVRSLDGVQPAYGGFFDQLLGREGSDATKAVSITQHESEHALSIKIEISVRYGENIPQKAEEVQNLIAKEVSCLTGLHVKAVHVVFRNLYTESKTE